MPKNDELNYSMTLHDLETIDAALSLAWQHLGDVRYLQLREVIRAQIKAVQAKHR